MSTKNFRVSDGDWICPDKKCGNVNFARRTSCNRCGREKTTEAKMMKAGGTEIGKTLAEKSRGLFSANDWQCKTCSNVNWARRSECNMCNTPKYTKLEERTGYGGGFNERENVEYIEREESDGEYDEFGPPEVKTRVEGAAAPARAREAPPRERRELARSPPRPNPPPSPALSAAAGPLLSPPAPRKPWLRTAQAAQRPAQPMSCPQPQPRADIRICSPPGRDATPTPHRPWLPRSPGARGRGASIAHRGRAAPQGPGSGPVVPRGPPPPARCARPAHVRRCALWACRRACRFRLPALGSQSRVLAPDSGSVGAHRPPCGSSLPQATRETHEGAEQGRDSGPRRHEQPDSGSSEILGGWKGGPRGRVISDTWDS
ncbi:hypothetical protein ABFV05_001426 [Capra hircus]